MANLEVTFVNVGDNGEMDVELDDTCCPEQIIPDLIHEGFIPPIPASEQGSCVYTLTVKGRGIIPEGQSLAAAGVCSGDKIRVAIARRGGGGLGLFGYPVTPRPSIRYRCQAGPHDIVEEDVKERDAAGNALCPEHHTPMVLERESQSGQGKK